MFTVDYHENDVMTVVLFFLLYSNDPGLGWLGLTRWICLKIPTKLIIILCQIQRTGSIDLKSEFQLH